jgi:hypothetical protein
MRRQWHLVGVPVLLMGALFVTSSPGQEPAKTSDDKADKSPPIPVDAIRDFADLKKLVRDLKASVETLKTSVASLTDRISTLEQTVDRELQIVRSRSTNADLAAAKAHDELLDLKKQLERARTELGGLSKRPEPTPRMSGYAGPGGTPPAPAPGGTAAAPARVRLVNTFYEPVSVVVNGLTYTLGPGEVRLSAPLTPGPFYYEVLNVQGRRDLVLNPAETFTVTIYPH